MIPLKRVFRITPCCDVVTTPFHFEGYFLIRSIMPLLTYFKIFVLEVVLNIVLHFVELHIGGLEFIVIKILLKALFKLWRDWMEDN